MDERKEFEILEEWLSLEKAEFRMLSLIAILSDSNRAFRGTLSTLCKELSIGASTVNKERLKNNLYQLAAADLITIIKDNNVYTISLAKAAEKSKNIIKIKKAWYQLIKDTPSEAAWENVLKVFIKLLEFAPASIHKEQEIADELNISVSTVKRAIKTLKQIDFQDFRFKIEPKIEKLADGKFRTLGNTYSQAIIFE